MNLHAPSFPTDDDVFAQTGGRSPLTGSGYSPRRIAGLALIAAAMASAMLLTNCAPSGVVPATAAGSEAWEEGKAPVGWAAAGPFNHVTVKHYPAYRSAVTECFSQMDGLARLRNHLRTRQIPMCSPVEMGGVFEEKGWHIQSMAFLYPSVRIGQTGFADPSVVVRDNPGGRYLSYAWTGGDDDARLAVAKQALDRAAGSYHQRPGAYRLLAYNSPSTIGTGRRFELQTMLH